MATKTLLTVEQYTALQEPEGVGYELNRGELIGTPSPSYFHDQIRHELNARLRTFVKSHKLGGVTSETDLKLAHDVVRRPDVAFISAERLRGIDRHRIPVPLSPDLVVELVSENDRADDLSLRQAPWSAVAAATAFLAPGLAEWQYEATAEGRSCCYRTPRPASPA
jgi:Uma2 family endonuclease